MRSSRPIAAGVDLVADTSVVVHLARCGFLGLLEAERTLLPPAVVDEILRGPPDPARKAIVEQWGARCAVPLTPTELGAKLDMGETEVIAAAHQFGVRAALDDQAAREAAI